VIPFRLVIPSGARNLLFLERVQEAEQQIPHG